MYIHTKAVREVSRIEGNDGTRRCQYPIHRSVKHEEDLGVAGPECDALPGGEQLAAGVGDLQVEPVGLSNVADI